MRKGSPLATMILSLTILLSGCRSDSKAPDGPGLPSPTAGPEGVGVPTDYAISAPYPNPFNPTTVVEIALPKESQVLLVVQNPVGDVIETLLSGTRQAGYYLVVWDASGGGTRDLKGGLYFITLYAGGFAGSRVARLEK